MAKTPQAGGKPSASTALAAAQAAARKAQAEVARLKAEAAEDAPPADDEDDTEAPDAEIDDDAEAEPDAETAEAAEDDDDDQTEAEKIAASPEAEANPKAATAAIVAGLTYAQFRKTSAAFSGVGARRLESTLKGSPRLGADAAQGGQKASAGLDPSAIYKRRAERAKGSIK